MQTSIRTNNQDKANNAGYFAPNYVARLCKKSFMMFSCRVISYKYLMEILANKQTVAVTTHLFPQKKNILLSFI